MDAMRNISETFQNVSNENWQDVFDKIPDIKPFENDKI
jgi:hypothetical protein